MKSVNSQMNAPGIIPLMCALAVTTGATKLYAQEKSVIAIPPMCTPKTESPHDEFPLWPNGSPGVLGNNLDDTPTLTPFFAPPSEATGAALVVCPGGGYAKLSPHEGIHFAMWLNEQGITAFVLKYRLGSNGYHHPAMMHDGQRALRYVRANAVNWKLDPQRIGIIGSSAGGHLGATCLTHFDDGRTDAPDPVDRVSCRPDLGILCYPVITMGLGTHAGSKQNLLGDNPDPVLVESLSNEKQVTPRTPPTFIFHTFDDAVVKVENSLWFAVALRRCGVPFALHIYPNGHHGLGLGTDEWDPEHRHPWTTECALWLKDMGFGR